MKITKTIIITNDDGTTEITLKRDGDAKFDSKKFKRDFASLVDNVMITLLEKECHYSDIK